MTNPHKPNFENAKVGDKCFSAQNDEEAVISIKVYGICVDEWIGVSSYFSYNHDGKANPMHKHPTLFNSFQQFLDYWTWEQENGGEK